MIQLEVFDEHLQEISNEAWRELLDMIPTVRNTETFGMMEQGANPLFPFVKPCKVVKSVLAKMGELQLFPVFEWPIWKEGQKMINDASFSLDILEVKEMCMLLTVIYRLDKFTEGFMVGKFEDGTMLRIMEALERRVG